VWQSGSTVIVQTSLPYSWSYIAIHFPMQVHLRVRHAYAPPLSVRRTRLEGMQMQLRPAPVQQV
jgi:hypothetical protein